MNSYVRQGQKRRRTPILKHTTLEVHYVSWETNTSLKHINSNALRSVGHRHRTARVPSALSFRNVILYNWVDLTQDRNRWQALANKVINLQVS